MILGSQSTYYTLLNCSKWLEGRQRCNIEQKASTIYQQDNLNVFRQQNFLPVFYQKKAGDMPLAISSPHQHHALLCTLVCYGFRLLSLYIGHMLSNVNGPFSYTKSCVCFQFRTESSQIVNLPTYYVRLYITIVFSEAPCITCILIIYYSYIIDLPTYTDV